MNLQTRTVSPHAGLMLLAVATSTFQEALHTFKERVGPDAHVVVNGAKLYSLEPVVWGAGRGHLKVEIQTEAATGDLEFEVCFRAVDDLDFHPVSEARRLRLHDHSGLEQMVVALSAIHESAKAHLEDGLLENVLNLMADLDEAAVNKLME